MVQSNTAPKYEQAYRTILGRLKAGRYPVGGRMPTESELATQFEISRVTIRRTLDMLVRDGYIESRQGSGYRVLTLSPASDTCLTSFTDAMLQAGRDPTSHLLSIDKFPNGAPETDLLPIDVRKENITRVCRLRLVDDEPSMLVYSYAPSNLLRGAKPSDFPETGPEQSILRILAGRFKMEWSSACEDISPIAADADAAEIFNVPVGTPLLKQACSAFDDQGQTVFYEEVIRNGTVSFNLSQQTRSPRHV